MDAATRYPVLLVHGLAFRDDWERVKYWGRIPDALEEAGARVYFSRHQSAVSVAEAATEVATAIELVLAEAATDQVNVIAHSKGGLDTRWAISQLGYGPKVASLTTVNTPHRGCSYADLLLERVPQSVQSAMGRGYHRLFTRLGDSHPDLLSALTDLSAAECARLNELMPNWPGVLYQSVGSRMNSFIAATPPLNLFRSLIERVAGPNDGLVPVSSMPWGRFLGIIEPQGRFGVSHADMVDVARRPVGGFDPLEFYVTLASDLRDQGL